MVLFYLPLASLGVGRQDPVHLLGRQFPSVEPLIANAAGALLVHDDGNAIQVAIEKQRFADAARLAFFGSAKFLCESGFGVAQRGTHFSPLCTTSQ